MGKKALDALSATVHLLRSHSRKISPPRTLLWIPALATFKPANEDLKKSSVGITNRGIKMYAVTIAKDANIEGSLIDENILQSSPLVS